MKIHARPTVALLVLACLGVGAGAAAAEQDTLFFGRSLRPLLYFVAAESSGDVWAKRQVYIFRDGTILVAALSETPETVEPQDGYVFSGQASPRAMRTLFDALDAIPAETQTDCSLPAPEPTRTWSFAFTWFGTHGRHNSFAVSDHSTAGSCSGPIPRFIDAVEIAALSAYRSRKATQISAR